jgi:EF hand
LHIQKVMAEVDTSGDGKVSLEEFVNAIQSNCAALKGELDAGGDEGGDEQTEEQEKDDAV